MNKNFFIYTLGCPKNSVDSQSMAELLTQAGYALVEDEREAGFIIVNTCGFIQPAKQEALTLLRGIVKEKQTDQKLIAAGCLTQREGEQVLRDVPGVDAILGTRRWMDVLPLMQQLTQTNEQRLVSLSDQALEMEDGNILRAAPMGGYAYLKIADGCDRSCAFCAIPAIKGPQVSREQADILRDVRLLAENDIQELILIAQDVTTYGSDLGMNDGLPGLLREIASAAPNIPWIRLMYTYPGHISPALVDCMAQLPQVLPYLDIPLQHAHPAILKRMRRPANIEKTEENIARMRAMIPDLSIRSTFIVGFPGETEAEFSTLLDFVERMRFDRVGIFPYWHEEGTAAYAFEDALSAEEKEERVQRLAAVQEGISLEKNRALVGREMDVIVDGVGDGISICRTYRDAPEVDGMVMVEDELDVGTIARVRISTALVHDLVAVKVGV